jgi:serine/threonine-protein kinase
LLYPSNWVNEEIFPGANLTYLTSFNPPASEIGEFVFVYVAVKNLTNNNTSLKQFADQEINLLKRPPAVTSPTEDTSAKTILESGPAIVAGNTSAHKVVYTEKISGSLSKIMEVYTVKDNKGYILTYLAYADIYDKFLPIAQKMVDSLNVTIPRNQ